MEALRRRYEERKSTGPGGPGSQVRRERRRGAGRGRCRSRREHLPGGAHPDARRPRARASAPRRPRRRADAILAETYTKQASYEEKNGQWAEAARSWARVCKARPDDAAAHERAANALLKAQRRPARGLAARPARVRARAQERRLPRDAGERLPGGRLTLNARRELETAAQLAPHDDTIQAMLKRVGKSA